MNFYNLGVVAGIIFAVAFALIWKFVRKKNIGEYQYDERQEMIRGRGYRIGFFAVMAGVLVDFLLHLCMNEIPVEESLILVTIIFVAGTCMMVYDIWNDAYYGLKANRKTMFGVSAVLCITQFSLFALNANERPMVVDGVLTFDGMISFELGLFFAIFFFTQYLKNQQEKKEEME